MNTREQAIAYISGAIATYSLRKERGELEDQASMYDFLTILLNLISLLITSKATSGDIFPHVKKSKLIIPCSGKV